MSYVCQQDCPSQRKHFLGVLASTTKSWPLIFVTGPWVERVGWVEHDGVVCFIFGKACPVVVRNILVVVNLVLFDSPVMDLIAIPLGAARMPTFLLVAIPAKTSRNSTSMLDTILVLPSTMRHGRLNAHSDGHICFPPRCYPRTARFSLSLGLRTRSLSATDQLSGIRMGVAISRRSCSDETGYGMDPW